MEQFFSPIRRFQDIWEKYNDVGTFHYTEVQLSVTVEEFLNYSWDWEDLLDFAYGDEEVLYKSYMDHRRHFFCSRSCFKTYSWLR